jgi:hypothetical protein
VIEFVLWSPQNNLGETILRPLVNLKIFVDVLDDYSRGSMNHA